MKKKPDTITLDLNGKPMVVSRPNPDRLVSLPATVPLLDFKLIKNKKLTAKVRFGDKSEQMAEFHPNESITHYDANAQLVQFIKKEPVKGNGQSVKHTEHVDGSRPAWSMSIAFSRESYIAFSSLVSMSLFLQWFLDHTA